MKNFTAILILVTVVQLVCSFQLQGTWTVAEIKGFPILYESVTLEVSDSVYRNTSIIQKIVFAGCQSYQYLMQFNLNNVFISYSSIQFNQMIKQQATNSSGIKCTTDSAKMHAAIRSNLVQVFYFQIVGNYLVFLNPKKEIVFKFQRVQSLKVRNLRGIWNLTSIKGSKVSQKVQIADTEITLCSGKIIVGYIMSDKYGFKTRLVHNEGGCQIKDLDKTILSSAFMRKIGNTLEIYDNELNLVILMIFVSDFDLSVIEAQRLKAIQDAKKSQQQAAKIAQQQQQKVRQNQSSLIKAQYQQQSLQLTLTLLNNKDDLLGIWQPVSVMGFPITDDSNIYFIISTNMISFRGGCNNIQFQYTVMDDQKGNNIRELKIGQNKSSSQRCQVDDDGLYVNGMSRIRKYGVSVVGTEIRLKLTDTNGNVVYQMRKSAQQQSGANTTPNIVNNNKNTNSQQSPQQSLPSTSNNSGSFQNGRYVFLVLARRDLPRKFCTVSGNKISYSGCNNIQHTIKILGNNQLQITGGPITNNNCAMNNDSILINAFNSIVSFINGKEPGSYVLKTANNIDVINFSQF